jgi:carboxylesterase type B
MTPRTFGSKPLPVMIFITGGNFQQFDAPLPVYYPECFVNNTNIIVGFIQYLLGEFVWEGSM